MTKYRICIVTGTRADWGLLTPLARALQQRADVHLDIVATNMHLLEGCGMTVHEIEEAGFEVSLRVPMEADGDDGASRARAMGLCLQGMADALETLRPDCVIVLGDRYEMLAVASAATVMRIPLVHIAGGTISEGAVDDAIRHAITKLAGLHLVETDEAAARVIQMGENPADVAVTGALGVWNIMHQPLMNAAELSATLDGFACDPRSTLLVTYHPATLDGEDPAVRTRALLDALDRFPESRILVTYPNNDAGGASVTACIEEWAAAQPERVKAVRSLGMRRYLSALKQVAAVVGNSSSGIVEVPSMGIPTVDVGVRQRGRLCADSVIHCSDSTEEIAAAIGLALSPTERERARHTVNPYYRPDTVALMVDAIMHWLPRSTQPKKFHNRMQ